ncbi:MAG: hypothetical protein ABFC30_06185 [Proteiniphilum sp.]
MKTTIYPLFMITGIIALLFASCNDEEYGPRKESTPVIVSATVNPSSFTFGDTLTLSAEIIDPATMLSNLFYEVVTEGNVIASGSIPLSGDTALVTTALFVPLIKNQADNAPVTVNLIAQNVLKGTVGHTIEGLTGKRPTYDRLYLVTDYGAVAVLNAEPGNQYKFAGSDLMLDPSFRFKIAEKLHADNTIDFSGHVYGNVAGRLGMINETGESSFAFTPTGDYTKGITFDNLAYTFSTTGGSLGADDLSLSVFGSQDIDNEFFRTLTRVLENGKTYSLIGILGDKPNLYNPDFFERLSDNQVKFLGKTGEYTLYYNPVRKNVFVGTDNPAYPDYLLACGWGLGYPTRVTSAEISTVYPGHGRTHTSWGFGHVMQYVLLRQINEGVYQGTFYTPGDNDHYAGFKPFENTGWGNEKKAGDFTFTGEPIITGDNDWTIANGENDPVVESAYYRFTVNLTAKTVHIEKVTL